MSRFFSAVCLFAALSPVTAQESAPQSFPSGTPAWFITSARPAATATMDVGRLEKQGEIAVSMSALYYVTPQESANGPVDFIQTLDAYDCSQPGHVKNVMGEGYKVGQQPPVFAYNNPEAIWKFYSAGSPGMDSWKAACEGPLRELQVKNVKTHEQVLEVVRQQARELDAKP